MVTRCLSARGSQGGGGGEGGSTVSHQCSGGRLVPIATLLCASVPCHHCLLFSTLPFWNYQTLRSRSGPQLSLTPVWDRDYISKDTKALSGELWSGVGLEMTFLVSPLIT